MGRRFGVLVITVVVSGLAASATMGATVGNRDPTFNAGAPLFVHEPGGPGAHFLDQETFDSAVVDPDNRITLAGAVQQQQTSVSGEPQVGFLARLTGGGALDGTFGTGGLLEAAPYDGASTMTAAALGLDNQFRLTGAFETDVHQIAARLIDNGHLDVAGYGQNGFAEIAATTTAATAVGPDGSVYFVHTQDNGTTVHTTAARINPSGLVDAGYAGGGAFGPPDHGSNQPVLGAFAAVDSQNRLVVARNLNTAPAGTGRYEVEIIRFTAAGALDASFNPTGSVPGVLDVPGPGSGIGVSSLAIGPGDQIVFGGPQLGSQADINYITELTATGATSSFGTQTLNAFPGLLAVQPDGKIIQAKINLISNSWLVIITRYTTSGALDTTFPGTGVFGAGSGATGDVISPPFTDTSATDTARATALTVTPDGHKLVLVGQWSNASDKRTTPFAERYLLQDPSLAPELTHPPTATGTPIPGQALTCSPGTWTNSPSIQVFWDRAPRATTNPNDPAWTQIGASGPSYTLTNADLGSRVRCREQASNANGSATGLSSSVRVDSGVPVVITPPAMSGVAIVGQLMRCDTGQWSNGPDLDVQWLRNGSAIPQATATSYTLTSADLRSHVSCRVTASNDVGIAAPAVSGDLLVVRDPPSNISSPQIGQVVTGPKATDRRLSCTTGTWDQDYGQYDYTWEREGAPIAGATGPTYDATVDDLGRDIRCVAYSTNPVGRSQGAPSPTSLVQLPATGQPGAIYEAGGVNHLDPINLMAVTPAWLDALKGLVLARRQAAAAAARTACSTGADAGDPLPSFAALTANVQGVYMSAKDTCGVLLHAPPEQLFYPNGGGIYWTGNGVCHALGFNNGPHPCPTLRIIVPVLNAATPPSSITPLEQATFDAVKPVEVLWDFNGDGRTDASCDPDAPIVRTLPTAGNYDIHAVVISADSAQTGIYSVSDLKLPYFPTSASQAGTVRSAQPFACKTSLDPPPDPVLPCINSATIGRTHVVGNICPISARSVPEADLDGLPPDVQSMLENQSLNGALRSQPAPLPTDYHLGFRAAPLSTAYVATTQLSALSTFGNDGLARAVPNAWASALRSLPSFNITNAQYAMDQVYVIKGAAKINGIDFTPVGNALTVMVPSDAGKAIADVKQMTISNRDVATALGGVPLGDAAPLSSDLTDAVNAAAPTLRDVNLDALAQSLLPKLDLGPFKLAGDAKLRMADDGTAFIDAQAQLKGPFSTGSGPIRTSVTVRASPNGQLSLQGVHLDVPKALLGAVTVSGLKLDYDGSSGLNIQGALLFPPINDGIQINSFRVDGNGNFKELDVSYLAGAGQGIDIGPGLFLVKLGGGLSLDPDEIHARAAVSVGPSSGGGCPTAGVDADLNVHWGPPPFFVDANSTVELVCIPVGNVHFHADSTGLVQLNAKVNLNLDPFYIDASLNGELRLPDWQIDVRGDGGIRHVISGTVKALISNLGIAGCGRVEIFPATPFTDSVTIAAGAGIHFSNGIPPLSFPQLLADFDAFTGCDLTRWSPFGRDARAAAADGSTSFVLGKDAPKVVGLQIDGAHGAPKVQIITPAGKTLDASGFGDDFTRTANLSGLTDPAHTRTVLFVRGAPGRWTIRPVAGSVPITNVMQSEVLPAPKVTAKVGGSGASRTLRYHVAPLSGEVVRFVEQSNGGQRSVKVVRNGGTGTAHFVTSEGKGTKRVIIAQVSQNGIPRDNITVAHFSAPSPRAGRPRVTLHRHGASVTVTWKQAQFAQTYLVTVATGRGRRFLLTPKKAGTRSVTFGGMVAGEGATVTVVGVTAGGHRGTARVVRLSGALKTTTITKRNRWQTAAGKKKKAKKKPRPRTGPAGR